MNTSPESECRASSIRCESLSVLFESGVQAVDAVDLVVPAGEIVALIGPSGCGKTTLLRTMAGLQHATTGRVSLDPPLAGRDGDIGFVFQQSALMPWQTALENVMLPLELTHGAKRKQTHRKTASEMLDRVQLGDAMHRMPGQLSGGMKMRVSIARALVTQPSVLFLDEPFAALDDMLRNELGELLLSLWREQQFTAVLVTHNIAESILLSHQIVVMHDSKTADAIHNPLKRPRTGSLRRSPEFGDFYGRISDALRDGVHDHSRGIS